MSWFSIRFDGYSLRHHYLLTEASRQDAEKEASGDDMMEQWPSETQRHRNSGAIM